LGYVLTLATTARPTALVIRSTFELIALRCCIVAIGCLCLPGIFGYVASFRIFGFGLITTIVVIASVIIIAGLVAASPIAVVATFTLAIITFAIVTAFTITPFIATIIIVAVI
jgi:hypothetical protein